MDETKNWFRSVESIFSIANMVIIDKKIERVQMKESKLYR